MFKVKYAGTVLPRTMQLLCDSLVFNDLELSFCTCKTPVLIGAKLRAEGGFGLGLGLGSGLCA